MNIRRSISGGMGPTRIAENKDPYRKWFMDQRAQLEAEGQIGSWENPAGGEVEWAAALEPFSIYRCVQDGFLFANPRVKSVSAARYFSSAAVSAYFPIVENSMAFRREKNYIPVAQALSQKLGRGLKLLEIGCGGGGGFLEVLREFGFQTEGVEVAEGAVPFWKKRGLKVHQMLVEDFSAEEKFDVILMWSVMDHFYDPVQVLRHCRKLLKTGGCIFIGNINTDGFDHLVMGFDCATFSPPGRVNYYNVRSLSEHLRMAGFDIEEVKTPGVLDVDMVGDYWRNGGVNGRHAFLEKVILEEDNESWEYFQKFITDTCFSGYMTILARATRLEQ